MELIRTAIERFSRNIILKRHLPSEFGKLPIYVSPDAGLRYWKPNMTHRHNSEIYKVVTDFIRENDIIWDIGGSVGIFAFPAIYKAGVKGSCLIAEADNFMQRLLIKSISANVDFQIEMLPVAISNSIGFAKFNIANKSRSTNFLAAAPGSSQTGGIRQVITVPTFTLDSLLDYYAQPTFVKIDVEGAEVSVLEGANIILAKARPTIFMEVFQSQSDKLQKILADNDYAFLDARNYQKVDDSTEDYICVPIEKLAEFDFIN